MRLSAYTLGGTNGYMGETAASVGRLAGGSINIRYPVTLPVATTRWRLRAANYQGRDEIPYATLTNSNVRIGSAWVGKHLLSEEGDYTGRFEAGTQGRVVSDVTLPAGGGAWEQPAWVTDPALQFPAMEPMLLSVGMTCHPDQRIASSPNKTWQNWAAGAGALVAGDAAPGLILKPETPLALLIEYEFDETVYKVPVVMVLGDSITDGAHSEYGQATNYGNVLSRMLGVPVIVHAFGGGTAYDFASSRPDGSWGYKWSRMPLATIKPDLAFVGLGTNDLGGDNASVDQTRRRLRIVARRVWSFGTRRILFNRITPRLNRQLFSSWTAHDEEKRRYVNAWMSRGPDVAAGAVYTDVALSDERDYRVMAPEYRMLDMLHPNTEGQARMAAELARFVR